MLKTKQILGLALAFMLNMAVFIGCKHESTDSQALVTVIDSASNPLEKAQVIFSVDTANKSSNQNGNPNKIVVPGLPDTLYTNASGTVSKEFQNGVVVLLKGMKVIGPLDTIKGNNYVVLQAGHTISRTLRLLRKH